MSLLTRAVLAAALVLATRSASAREFEVEIIAETVEDLYAYEDRGDLSQSDVETLSGLLLRPIDLNRADRNILFELPGVTNLIANAIVRYRSENGDFKTVEELANVPGLQDIVLTQVRPFLTVSELVVGGPTSLAEEAGLSGFARSGLQYRRGFVPPWDDFDREIDPLLERAHGSQMFAQFQTSAYTYFQVGGLMTYRRGMSIDWDPTFNGATGRFISADGPNNRVRFDQLYLTSTYGGVNVILGSFTAGFGERLTFNTTEFQLPSGWYSNITFTEDNELARIRVRDRQFGVAVQYDGFNVGRRAWLDATVFASSNLLDLFQRDFAYEGNGDVCGVDGYTCSDVFNGNFPDARTTSDFVLDGRARSIRVSAPDDSANYDFEQLRRAYREDLIGGNLTLHFDDNLAWGVTSYVGQTDFNFDDDAGSNFGYSSGRVRQELQAYGAVGTHLRWLNPYFDLGAEYARTIVDGGGNGFLLRANVTPIPSVELTTRLWYYGANFINPQANGSAGADEAFGERDRNDRGGQIRAVVKPMRDLRLRTTVEYRQNPNQIFLTPDGYESFRRETILDDITLAQRVDYGLTVREDVFLNFSHQDRVLRSLDLAFETFSDEAGTSGDSGDACFPLTRELSSGANAGLPVSDCSTGTRSQLQLGFKTTRIPSTSLYFRGDYIRQAQLDTDQDGDTTRGNAFRFVLRARVKPWEGGTLIGNITLRPEQTFGLDDVEDDGARITLVTSEPRQYYYLEYIQKFGRSWTFTGRYGYQDYDRIDPDNRFDVGRFSFYHAFRLKAEYRF
ncbi:MAG: helix-hairpin-helix domain-containing protein [Myxococcota bacterium]